MDSANQKLHNEHTILSTRVSSLSTEAERSSRDIAVLSKGVNALKESDAGLRGEVEAAARTAQDVDGVSLRLDALEDRSDGERWEKNTHTYTITTITTNHYSLPTTPRCHRPP